MTRTIRSAALSFVILVAVPGVVLATIQQLRGQIPVAIVLVVSTPVAMVPGAGQPVEAVAADGDAKTAGIEIVARLDTRPRPVEEFHAEQLSLLGKPELVAQSNQGAVKVEAEVSPNPNATLLYQTCPTPPAATSPYCSSGGATIPVTAGVTTTVTCAYQVVVDTTQSSWTLDHGLYTDFENSGTGAVGFAGGYVSNSAYYATPKPAFTPFVVYSDDGGTWAKLTSSSYAKTFCVDLEISVPASVAAGTYSSNATYSVYY
jgi:hypothetical protein